MPDHAVNHVIEIVRRAFIPTALFWGWIFTFVFSFVIRVFDLICLLIVSIYDFNNFATQVRQLLLIKEICSCSCLLGLDKLLHQRILLVRLNIETIPKIFCLNKIEFWFSFEICKLVFWLLRCTWDLIFWLLTRLERLITQPRALLWVVSSISLIGSARNSFGNMCVKFHLNLD